MLLGIGARRECTFMLVPRQSFIQPQSMMSMDTIQKAFKVPGQRGRARGHGDGFCLVDRARVLRVPGGSRGGCEGCCAVGCGRAA